MPDIIHLSSVTPLPPPPLLPPSFLFSSLTLRSNLFFIPFRYEIALNLGFYSPISRSVRPLSCDLSSGYSSGNMHGIITATRGPFTPSQWMELEHQALIYKYITANVAVPSHLLIPIRKALDSAGFSNFSNGLLRPNARMFLCLNYTQSFSLYIHRICIYSSFNLVFSVNAKTEQETGDYFTSTVDNAVPDLVILINVNELKLTWGCFWQELVNSIVSFYTVVKLGMFGVGVVGWGGFHLGFSNNTDPEPGRCRRTDGKKWRCSRDAVVDQKYCERHMNRGRHRSRKPVEGQSGHAVTGATTTTTTATTNNISAASKLMPNASSSVSVVVPGNAASNTLTFAHHQSKNLQPLASDTSAANNINRSEKEKKEKEEKRLFSFSPPGIYSNMNYQS